MASVRRSSRTKGHDTQQQQQQQPASSAPTSELGGESTHPPFTLTIPAEISIDQLKMLLPEDASLDAPTPDNILELYRVLLDFGQRVHDTSMELDETRADAQRKEVEMEQTVVDSQNEAVRLSTELHHVTAELNALGAEKAELVHSRDSLQLQISSMSSNQLTSSSDLNLLRQKVEETERANRDLIGVVDRMKVYEADQQQEIDTLRERLKSTRHENTALQTENGELKSMEATSKFKVDTLNQELTLVREENERYKTELDEKAAEFATFRRTKHAEIVQLQTELESLKQTYAAAHSQLDALRESHSSQSQSHTEALQKINNLKADLADQESKFRSELSTQKRLVTLLESRNEEARQRVQEVDAEWEKMVEAADAREAELHAILGKERSKVDALQQRVDDLRAVIDKMGTGELPILMNGERGAPSSAPGTPGSMIGGPNGSMMLSPTASLATRFQRSGRTFTEVYADYVRLQAELATEKQESSRLSECLAQILADIEERAPTLQEQRIEYERIQRELMRLGPQLAEALQERDIESRNARIALDRAAAKEQENALLERQLSDMGRQLRHVVRELAIHEDPSLENEQTEDNRGSIPDVTDTDIIITDQLTLFRSLPELQDQNQRLLRITREMSTKLEAIENEQKETAELVESEAVRRAKVTIEGLHGKIKGQETAERALRKEIDMLGGMLVKARQGVLAGAPAPGDLREPHTSRDNLTMLETDRLAEMSSVLKEMGANSTRLQDDLAASQKHVAQLNVNLAKANAQIDFLNERHRISEQTNDIQRREVSELQKRNSKYQSQIASLEVACHSAQDQNREANAALDRLRSETANLRAEKSLLKDIESRLSFDLINLNKDNARLNSLLRDSQTIHDDINRSVEGERRRLENHIQLLESQTQDLRAQVNKELDRNRHISLQKDVEIKELQSKIESTTSHLSSTREALVIAQTDTKHLTTKIEDLTRSVEGSHEKLAVYERHPTASGSQDLSSGDDLKREVAELRAALKGAELDVETARNHADQYRSISETNEQALADLQQTYDEYSASSNAELDRLQAEVASLRERIRILDNEVVSSAESTAALRRQLEEQQSHFEAEKRDLEYALADVNSAESNAANVHISVQEELRRQATLTQEAHEKYERELIAHAEAVRIVGELRQQLAATQTALHDHQSVAETAQANLLDSQTSWAAQKETLDKELHDLRARYDDITNQNAILHKHLESVSTQATSIRQAEDQRASLADGAEPGDSSSEAISELRSVVAYLRREKEIVDLQLDLSRQETIRLRTQVEHLNKNVDETRSQLAQEREQAANSVRSAAQHSELLEKINQLNILRESNSTLRAESEANGKKVQQLEEQLHKSLADVGPLRSELLSVRAELAAREDQIKLLETESERWKTRNSQLLSQYKQVDPEDLRVAKEDAETLRKEFASLQTDYASLQAAKEKLQASFVALRNQSKGIIENQKATIATSKTENEALLVRIAETESKAATDLQTSVDSVNTLREELARKDRELSAATQSKLSLEARLNALGKSHGTVNQMEIDSATTGAIKSELEAASSKVAELQTSYTSAQLEWAKEKQELEAKVANRMALEEKHKGNARKFFLELKAAKKALGDANIVFPTPAPAALAPLEPIAEPTPSPEVAPQVASTAHLPQMAEVPKPAANTDQTTTVEPVATKIGQVEAAEKQPETKHLKAISVPAIPAVTNVETPSMVTTIPAVSPENAPAAASTSAPVDRQAMLRERLANARKAAPPRPAVGAPFGAAESSKPAEVTAASSGLVATTQPSQPATIFPKAPTGPAVRGRGRGLPRGGRGGAGAGRGRGAVPPADDRQPAASTGLSISGAAKRPLEDNTEGGEGGNQKRIRVQRNRQPDGAAAEPS